MRDLRCSSASLRREVSREVGAGMTVEYSSREAARLVSDEARADSADSADSAMHAIDPIGVGDSGPKPKMRRRLQGGWAQPPRTPLGPNPATLTPRPCKAARAARWCASVTSSAPVVENSSSAGGGR